MEYSEMLIRQNKIIQEILDLSTESTLAALGVVKSADYLLQELITRGFRERLLVGAEKRAAKEQKKAGK